MESLRGSRLRTGTDTRRRPWPRGARSTTYVSAPRRPASSLGARHGLPRARDRREGAARGRIRVLVGVVLQRQRQVGLAQLRPRRSRRHAEDDVGVGRAPARRQGRRRRCRWWHCRAALAAREEAPPGLGEEPVLLGRRRAPLVLVVEPAIGTAASKLRRFPGCSFSLSAELRRRSLGRSIRCRTSPGRAVRERGRVVYGAAQW